MSPFTSRALALLLAAAHWCRVGAIRTRAASSTRTSKHLPYGVFAGMVVNRSFPRASFWGRDARVVTVEHTASARGSSVFSAEYSDGTGVSDLVYYSVDADRFCVGCGRGTGWQNDEELAAEYQGMSAKYYATRADYAGVGHFLIDRGHQAPVGSFNTKVTEADLTNLPTNLSPQSAKLNQKNWRFLETDVRDKAVSYSDSPDDRPRGVIQAITGPLYELPPAMFEAERPKQLWRELLVDGKEYVDKKGKTKQNPVPWCAEQKGDIYGDAVGKKAQIECIPVGQPSGGDPRANPNGLEITFNAGKRTSTPLRVPLGYFKMFVAHGGSMGRRTCAYIMDQVGQCLLVSVELLSKIAHIDLSGTRFAELAGGINASSPSSDDYTYTSYVNPYWCVPPGGTLRKRGACYFKTAQVIDPADITTDLMDHYWTKVKVE